MSTARGFTLIEVLVALAIVTVGMAALLGALSSAADTTSYLRDKTFAEWVAMNRIAEIRLQVRKPDKGKTSGEVEFAGRQWIWEQEVKETDVPGMMRVDVSTRPKDAPSAPGKPAAWLTMEAGIFGDAVAPPRGDLPNWEVSPGGGPLGGGGGDGKDDPPQNDGPGQGQQPGEGEGEQPPPRQQPRTRLGT